LFAPQLGIRRLPDYQLSYRLVDCKSNLFFFFLETAMRSRANFIIL